MYIKEHPSASNVEMDTVNNDVFNGPFIQIFIFVSFRIKIAVYYNKKNSETMVNGVHYIEKLLGDELFHSVFSNLLTDYAKKNYSEVFKHCF